LGPSNYRAATSRPAYIRRLTAIRDGYRLGTRINGERELVIDCISSRELSRLDCFFRTEINPIERSRRIVVLDDLRDCSTSQPAAARIGLGILIAGKLTVVTGGCG
jgi:hypothetical protein